MKEGLMLVLTHAGLYHDLSIHFDYLFIIIQLIKLNYLLVIHSKNIMN